MIQPPHATPASHRPLHALAWLVAWYGYADTTREAHTLIKAWGIHEPEQAVEAIMRLTRKHEEGVI